MDLLQDFAFPIPLSVGWLDIVLMVGAVLLVRLALKVGLYGLWSALRGLFSRRVEVDEEPEDIGPLTYRTSPGIRMITLLGFGSVLWLLRPAYEGESASAFGTVTGILRVEGLALHGPYAWYIFAAIAFLGFLYLNHIWSYVIDLDGSQMTYPTLGFGKRTVDLRKLDRVADSGPHGLRLYFTDGSRGDIMKQVVGMRDLRARIEAARA